MTLFYVYNVGTSYPGVEVVQGVDHYCLRGLMSTSVQRDELFWLPPELDNVLDPVLAHLYEAGIIPTKNIAFAPNWSGMVLANFPEYTLRPFIMNGEMHRWAGPAYDQWHRGFQHFESKIAFAEFCRAHNIPAAQSFLPNEVGNIPDSAYENGLVAKLDRTASGLGMATVRSRNELFQWKVRHNLPFVIQHKIDKVLELGIQLELSTADVSIVSISGQHIGTENDHLGNYAPWNALHPNLQVDIPGMKKHAMTIARAMYAEGIRGRAGIDVLVDGAGKFYFGEVNARRTGATPAIDAAQRLGVNQWSYKHTQTSARTVEELNLVGHPLCYRPGDEEGLLFINLGPIDVGKVDVMTIGAPDTWARQEVNAHSMLETSP